MLAKTVQIFDKKPNFEREVVPRAPGGKYEMISPRKNEL